MCRHASKDLGVGAAQDHGHGRTRRQTGHEHLVGMHGIGCSDLVHDADQDGRLSPFARLLCRLEPVPAVAAVGLRALGGVRDQETTFLGQPVHLRAGGKVIRVLLAAMQHHDQRHRHAFVGGGDVELVAAHAHRALVRQREKTTANWVVHPIQNALPGVHIGGRWGGSERPPRRQARRRQGLVDARAQSVGIGQAPRQARGSQRLVDRVLDGVGVQRVAP
jgi:hypothetical protein